MLQIARVRPNNKLWGVKVKLHRGNFLSNWKSKTQLFSKSFIFEYSYFSPLFHIFVCVCVCVLVRSLPFWRLSTSVCVASARPNPTCALQLVWPPNPTFVFLLQSGEGCGGENTQEASGKNKVGEKETPWVMTMGLGCRMMLTVWEKPVIQTNLVKKCVKTVDPIAQVVAPRLLFNGHLAVWVTQCHSDQEQEVNECKCC